MGRRAHWMKANKGVEIPVHAIFYDTETKSYGKEKDIDEARLWFGWACYTRRYRDTTWSEPTWCRFRTASAFWRWVGEHQSSRRKLYLFSHNTGFDFTILKGFKWAKRLGWANTGRIVDDPPTVIRFKRGTVSLCFIDTLNYFRLPLKAVGEYIGINKLEMPAEDRTAAEWDDYCKTDVLILVKAMQSFWSMVHEWDLGNFAYTVAGQAFAAYRHRFMSTPIFIDDNEQANELARSAYVGARTECFRLGEIKERIHCLDINSQYPFVMATTPVPIRLVTTLNRTNIEELRTLLKEYCLVADVTMTTFTPNFPKKIPGWTIFPVGKFRTQLNTPELSLAISANCVTTIHSVIVYERDVIFREYVNFFHEKRLEAKVAGNETLSFMLKLMMNSLYGKFGQNGRKYEQRWKVNNDAIKVWVEWDADSKTLHEYRQFAGVVEELQREAESRESFPAIAGHITSAARLLLLDYINQAGAENAFYCDTDSIFVTDGGYANLRGRISETQLGWLKHEWTSDNVTIYGVKDYRRDSQLKRKGIRSSAEVLDESSFRQPQFRGFKGMIRAGDLDHMLIRQVTKRLSRVYSKGTVDPDGRVHPLVFPHPDYPDP